MSTMKRAYVIKFFVAAITAIGIGAPVSADEEWKFRYFTRVRDTEKGKDLKNPITAEIRVVSKVRDGVFKAVVRDIDKPFELQARDFSAADQEYLRKWNPTFAIDLRDFPIEKVLEQSGYEVVPLQQADLAFFVPVTVNGEEMTFLVDTGAMGTVLDEDTAKKLEMPLRPSNVMMSGIEGVARRAKETDLKSLEIGNVLVPETPSTIFVLDLPNTGMALEPDGILGFELLKHLGGMIDYSGKRMFVRAAPTKK